MTCTCSAWWQWQQPYHPPLWLEITAEICTTSEAHRQCLASCEHMVSLLSQPVPPLTIFLTGISCLSDKPRVLPGLIHVSPNSFYVSQPSFLQSLSLSTHHTPMPMGMQTSVIVWGLLVSDAFLLFPPLSGVFQCSETFSPSQFVQRYRFCPSPLSIFFFLFMLELACSFWKSEVFYQHSVGIVPHVDIFCCICIGR